MTRPDPADERPHAVGSEPSWREAYGFDLHDAVAGLGGFLAFEARPNVGTVEVGLSFLLGDGGFVTARHVAGRSENPAELEVEDVRFAVVEPLQRWQVTYDGPSHSLASARDAGKRDAWAKSRLERLSVDLAFTASHDAVATGAGFVQPGRFTGEVWVSGDRYAIDAYGSREKRWGAAAEPRAERRFALAFGSDRAVLVRQCSVADGVELRGVIVRDGVARAVREIELATETEPGSYFQKTFRLALLDDDGRRHQVDGEMAQLAPLPGHRGGRDTMLCAGVAQVSYEGSTGQGVVEYLHQLDADGSPVEPVR